MQQTYSATRRVRRMQAQADNLQTLSKLVMFIVVAWLLASVAGCSATCPPVPASAFRPSAQSMEPGETQYLLPENLQRKKNPAKD